LASLPQPWVVTFPPPGFGGLGLPFGCLLEPPGLSYFVSPVSGTHLKNFFFCCFFQQVRSPPTKPTQTFFWSVFPNQPHTPKTGLDLLSRVIFCKNFHNPPGVLFWVSHHPAPFFFPPPPLLGNVFFSPFGFFFFPGGFFLRFFWGSHTPRENRPCGDQLFFFNPTFVYFFPPRPRSIFLFLTNPLLQKHGAGALFCTTIFLSQCFTTPPPPTFFFVPAAHPMF